MDQAKKYELEQTVKELGGYRGRHTELITVYIPAGFDKNQVTTQIEDEKGTATNIKSTSTRKNVINTLDKISRHLKTIKQTPPNGLALFSGNISDVEGKEDLRIWAIEPDIPIKTRMYRCDQTFVLEPLLEMLETDEVYGLLIIERNEATIGILEGNRISILQRLTSGIPGKVRAGGQSAARFGRITEGLAKEFFRRVAEQMKQHFFDNNKIKGLLVGGPIPTKDEFLETGNLVTKLKDKVISVKDIGDTGLPGLKDLVGSSQEELAELEITKQKKILEKFFLTLAKEPNKTAYGETETKIRLEQGSAETLIISKDMPLEKIKQFSKIANSMGTEIYIVTKETTDGIQFDNLGGVGAILRFAVA